MLLPEVLPSVPPRDSVLLAQDLQMRAEEHPGRTGVGGSEHLPFHLSAHPGALPLRCHMNSALAEAQGREGSTATAVGKRREGGRQAARDIPNLWLPLGAEGGLSDVGGQGPNPCRGKALSSGLLPALEGLTPAEPVWGKAAGLQGKRGFLGPATRFLPFTWCPLHS